MLGVLISIDGMTGDEGRFGMGGRGDDFTIRFLSQIL